ncbi:LamG domain-containing protein [Herbidospora sp. RD11066]
MTLLIHWPLDDVSSDQKVYDTSGAARHGSLVGFAKAVPDERFGSALNLAATGQYVQSASVMAGTYTFGVWVKTARPGATTPLLLRADLGVRLRADGSVEHRFTTRESTGNVHATPAGLVVWNTWQHVAVTNDGGAARIYVNGELADEWDFPGTRVPVTNPLVLAADLTPNPRLFTFGRYAHLRAYDTALIPAEIGRDLAEDGSTLAAFVRAHPMDLELLNVDQQPVLFIDNDPSGQPMTLRLTNSSRQNIELMPLGMTPNSANYHVAARLRPGVLTTPPAVATGSDKWKVQAASDGTALYLVGGNVGAIAPGNWVDIPLTGLNADPGGGTRGTRVQFDYHRLKYSGETDELTGSRLQFVDVVNHRGRPDIPLVMGFAGGNTVINDGATQSKLVVYVANTSTDTTITLAGGSSLFTLTFDVGADGNDWALTQGTAGIVVGATTPGTNSGTWSPVPHALDTRASWTFTAPKDFDLAPGKSIVFTVDKVVGLGDPGRAAIVIGYENIPGYRDGAQTLEADRQPVAFAGSYTGVGTQNPTAKLHVVDVNTTPNVGSVIIGPTGQSNLRLGYHADFSYVQSHGLKPLAINPITNPVGIGLSNPSARLHVFDQVNAPTTNGSLLIGPPAAGSLKIGYGTDHAWIQSGSTGVLALNPSGNRVIVGATGTTTVQNGGKLTVVAQELHTQLRRTAGSAGSGSRIFLELYQEEMATEIYPAIRFHQSGRFWHQIEGRPDGFHLLWSSDQTTHSDLIARELKADKLTLGTTSITAAQLQILAKLAAGQLTVTLYSDEIQATASPVMVMRGINAMSQVIGFAQPNQYALDQRFRLVMVPS